MLRDIGGQLSHGWVVFIVQLGHSDVEVVLSSAPVCFVTLGRRTDDLMRISFVEFFRNDL